MASTMILPGSWAEWAGQVADADGLYESGAIIRAATKYSDDAGMSCESALGMLAWLGSVATLNYTSVQWESGIWHPSAVTIAVVEADEVAIDSITSGFIKMVKGLGLDPIQDTVKEGPSGLISRLESARAKPLMDVNQQLPSGKVVSIHDVATMDTSEIEPSKPENIGNVRGLIYPSGRAFMSYLYDTPFFNSLDELIQHGSLHVKGKSESHALRNMNVAAFLPFYQGALANLMQQRVVQSNLNLLLRQMLFFWPATRVEKGRVHVGRALERIQEAATIGIKSLEALMPSHLEDKGLGMSEPMFDTGVGVRYVSLNRLERLTRLAVPVMFWRIAEGSNNFELTKADYAIAEVILHAHEMGSRIVEIASSKGRVGHEALKVFVYLSQSSGVSDLSAGISQLTDSTSAAAVLEVLYNNNILEDTGALAESYRLVKGDVIGEHRKRWNY